VADLSILEIWVIGPLYKMSQEVFKDFWLGEEGRGTFVQQSYSILDQCSLILILHIKIDLGMPCGVAKSPDKGQTLAKRRAQCAWVS